MRTAVWSDELTGLPDYVTQGLGLRSDEATLTGTPVAETGFHRPLVVRHVSGMIGNQNCDESVSLCFIGAGLSSASRKVSRRSSAICTDTQTAAEAQQQNAANLLAINPISEREAPSLLIARFDSLFE